MAGSAKNRSSRFERVGGRDGGGEVSRRHGINSATSYKRKGKTRGLGASAARKLRLSWMSPRIVEAIADGSQPRGLTRKLLLISDMPIGWADQERQFGLAA